MKPKNHYRAAFVFVTGIIIGVAGFALFSGAPRPSLAADGSRKAGEYAVAQLAKLQRELETIKGKTPGQAHAMIDVSYHFDNLWFAGQRGNWPLAQFYFNETRSHLRWAVRIIPVRKDSQGKEIKLADILESIENGPLKELEGAIGAKDRQKFTAAYQFTLESCYSCHKTVDKPYLTLKIPDHPAEALIEFNPSPTKPE